MYGLLISRAIEFGDQSSGVIPCFDMINHSPIPNLGLAFDGSYFEMIALRSIAKDEEVCKKRFFSCPTSKKLFRHFHSVYSSSTIHPIANLFVSFSCVTLGTLR
jgi:hypothetical protein